MQGYDVALKSVLKSLGPKTLQDLTSFAIERWLNVELPEVRNLRVDMLGETVDRQLVHIELQSTHDPAMALRMAEYFLSVYRQFGRFPEQLVLYVGRTRARMKTRLEVPNLRSIKASFEYRLVDIRDIDSERLLASDRVDDNVVAILTRLGSQRKAVRQILERIAAAKPDERGPAFQKLLLLAGLRKLGKVIKQEVRGMPILDDIMDHDLLGPEFRRGVEKGLEQGLEQGFQHELSVILRQTEKRFGSVPTWARERLEAMTVAEREDAALRLIDARSLEDLFGFR